MTRTYITTIILLISFTAWSQIKVLNPSFYLNADETQTDSAICIFQNMYPFDVQVIEVVSFERYFDHPFSVSDSTFFIPANATTSIRAYFHPNQNILYKQAIVFKTKSRGDFATQVEGQGSFSKNYYSTTQNKVEQSLKNDLNQLLASGYITLSYNAARDKMYGSIDNVGGDVECVYTSRKATFNTRAGANANSFNCEHTWPQSLFNSASPMKSDIHHLFPTDVTANSQRGSLPFGTVSNPSWSNGGSKKNSTHFEPQDSHKGAVARAMMYFVIRYQNYNSFFTSQESILRQWHANFPPSTTDINRNNDIYNEQNNRNPFVDYPQLIHRITSLSSTSAAPQLDSLYISSDTIQFRNLVSGDSLITSVVLYNAGNTDIEIDDVLYNSNGDYEILNNPNGITLVPGESYKLRLYMIQPFNAVHMFTIETDIGDFNRFVKATPDISLDEWIAEQIDVYPNPTIDHLRIFAPVNENLSYQLVDANGNIIMNGVFLREVIIDTRPLAWGSYFLNIYRHAKLYTKPVIKTSR